MRRFAIISAILAAWGAPALAQQHEGCSAAQVVIIDDALGTAKDLTLKAAVAVGDNSDFQRWFGAYSQPHAEDVRANLKAIVTALRGGGVTTQCDTISDDGCTGGEYAWVFPAQPYLLHLCPSFFNLPPLTALRPGDRRSDNGTREGTIVHEISHFQRVADTEDYCYSRSACSEMAREDAGRAIDNADSYQYFTEDVTYFSRQPVANKPPPAPRPNR